MAETTAIEWTDATWNPVRGCSRVSEGCRNCYAERVAGRFSGTTAHRHGEDRKPTVKDAPFAGFATITTAGPRWTGRVELVEKHLMDPLHWRKPKRVFVNSMSDLFHETLPFEAIDQIFTVMVAAAAHTYQILTKRPERMLEYFHSGRHDGGFGPDRGNYHLDQNIWLGVSVENRATKVRIDLLRETPAELRFLSIEPLLEDIGELDLRGIGWVIVGGESGPGARPFRTEWAESVVAQCKANGVACFVKQIGAHVIQDGERRIKKDKKGGDMHEWPHDIRVRQFPEAQR